MSLILKILSFNGQPYSEGNDVTIGEQGGTIGRADTNTLILNDENKIISRRHAVLKYENGQYLLTDSSLGGTFIDKSVDPIHNSSVQLMDGMHIRIGDYIISCQINDIPQFSLPEVSGNPFSDEQTNHQPEESGLSADAESDINSPFITGAGGGQDFSSDLLAPTEQQSDPDLLDGLESNELLNYSKPEFNELSVETNLLAEPENNDLLDAAVPESELGSQSSQGVMTENSSFLNDSFEPARPVENNSTPDKGEIPEDFNFEELFNVDENKPSPSTHETFVPEKETEVKPSTQNLQEPVLSETEESIPVQMSGINRTSASDTNKKILIDNDELIKAFLSGVQMESEQLDFTNPVDKLTRIGKMFRQFVESMVAVLRSRAEFKSMFRVNVTTIQRVDNNPLKFAVTTDDAIKQLINDEQAGFKASVESIDEGFNDLMNHQLAMQAGIQASLNDILRQFDPATIEKQYSEGIVLKKKSKCWDSYTQIHRRLSETAIDDFFGDAFSEAYDKQMKQLKK